MNNYEKYKTLHVTTEIMDHTYGGVGTVLNFLYENRTGNEVFIYIPFSSGNIDIKHKQIAEDVYEYSKKTILELFDLPFPNIEKIFIHTPEVLCLPKLKTKAIKIKVIHGIIPLENMKNFKLDSYYDSIFWDSYKNAHEVVMVSKSEVINLIKLVRIHGFKEKRISYIYNGIDFDKNYKINLNKSKNIGFIGRFDLRKGLLPVVEKMNSIPEYKLVIAGGGGDKTSNFMINNMSNILEFKNITNVVSIGQVLGERKASFFENMEFIVIPSTYEPFGMTVLESMQSGKIIIANKTGGIVEILGEDYPLYFNIFSENGLKNVIDKCENMSDDEKIHLIERNFKRLSFFSLENMIKSYFFYQPKEWTHHGPVYGIDLI